MKLIEYYIYECSYMFYRYHNKGIINPITQASCSNELTLAPSLKIVNDCEYYINYICNI